MGAQRLLEPDLSRGGKLIDRRRKGGVGRGQQAGATQEVLDHLAQVGAILDTSTEVDEFEELMQEIAEQVALQVVWQQQADGIVRVVRVLEARGRRRRVVLTLRETGVTRSPIGHRQTVRNGLEGGMERNERQRLG
jgi:hypothetical protein